MRKGIKAVIISVVSVVVAAAILVGVVWYIGRGAEPAKVYSADNFCMSGDVTGANYYYGPVRADNLQTVFLSDTQTVTELLVEEGQSVKKGDPLLRYDTTLSDIQLERKEISVKQAQLALETAQKELREIEQMKPYSPPPVTEPSTEAPTEPLEPEELPHLYGGKGTQESPYRILWSEELTYDETYLRDVMGEETEGWFAFEIREEDAVKGSLLSGFGLHVTLRTQENTEQTRLYYSFFHPTDVLVEDGEEPELPDFWIDDSSGYTAAEIAELRAAKQKEIRDCDLNYRMAKVELERMRAEVGDGTVYARLDGMVTKLTDPETARANGGALLVLNGGGCYYIDISVDEFTCQTLQAGMPITAEAWWPEMVSYEGQIDEITTTPSGENGYTGSGNPNVTYYKVVLSISGDAVLEEGTYLDVQLQSTGEMNDTLWLENMFIRYDGTRAYIYKRGADGTLEKCAIQTGASLWGSYTEVRSGLSMDDWIAFPYGKSVKEGAQTVESTPDELYEFY